MYTDFDDFGYVGESYHDDRYDVNYDYERDYDDSNVDDVIGNDSCDSITQQMKKVSLRRDVDLKGHPGRSGKGVMLKSENGTVINQGHEGLRNDINKAAAYRTLNSGTRMALDMGYDRNSGIRTAHGTGYGRTHAHKDPQLVTSHLGDDHDVEYSAVSFEHRVSSYVNEKKEKIILEFDGASKGNPGKSGGGAVLKSKDGTVITRVREGLGKCTNNEAEYRALIRGMKTALRMGYVQVDVKGDSQLVIKQVKDEWQTRKAGMARLCDEAKQLINQFKQFTISHVPRGCNSDADAEARKAVNLPDGQMQMGDSQDCIRAY